MHNDDRDDANLEIPFWLTPTSYWQPEHVVLSAWVTHAPFAFWLMDALRPRTVVELGSHLGFSCFVFAEGAKRLGHPVDIAALDTWKGDDQAGVYDDEVYEGVQAVVESDYPDSMRLLRGLFSESRALIADGSVDLLHIDGRHGYEDVRADFDEWVSAVADGGIIVFHDVTEHQEGFGVFRLWDELTAQYPSFTFQHGHGLGILAVNGVPAGLNALFSADTATADRIRDDFERLGDRVGEVCGRDATIEAMRSSMSWRVTRPLRAFGRIVLRLP